MGAPGISGRLVGIEIESIAGLHRGRAPAERAETKFRPLQVDQHSDRATAVTFNRADHANQLAHAILAGMAHVDAKDVSARLEQLGDHVGVR